MQRSITYLLGQLIIFSLLPTAALAQKLTSDDVISRHVDSVASRDVRAGLKTLIAVGDVRVTNVTRKTPPAVGRVVVASAGNRSFFGMNLNANDNPLEQIVFDGKRTKVAFTLPGTRSLLGNLLQSNSMMIEEGLLLGTLSTNWALTMIDGRRPKLSYDGQKKVGGIDTHVIRYSPRGGADFNVEMYFDQSNFRHVRTEYRRTASASIGRTIDESARQNETRIRVTEDFSDFRAIQNVTLPTKYRLIYSITGQNGTNEISWEFDLLEFGINTALDEKTFIVDSK
jgi:hypothetical protein